MNYLLMQQTHKYIIAVFLKNSIGNEAKHSFLDENSNIVVKHYILEQKDATQIGSIFMSQQHKSLFYNINNI